MLSVNAVFSFLEIRLLLISKLRLYITFAPRCCCCLVSLLVWLWAKWHVSVVNREHCHYITCQCCHYMKCQCGHLRAWPLYGMPVLSLGNIYGISSAVIIKHDHYTACQCYHYRDDHYMAWQCSHYRAWPLMVCQCCHYKAWPLHSMSVLLTSITTLCCLVFHKIKS